MLEPPDAVAAVGVHLPFPGARRLLHTQPVRLEHVDHRRPLHRHDVGERRRHRNRHSQAGLPRHGHLDQLAAVLDPTSAGDLALAHGRFVAAEDERRRRAVGFDAEREPGRGVELPPGGDGRRVGLAVHGDQPAGVPVHHLQDRAHELVRAEDACPVVFQHVRLEEQGRAVLKINVAGREARHVLRDRQALRRVQVVLEVEVRGDDVPRRRHRSLDVGRQGRALPLRQRREDVRPGVDAVGRVVLEIGPVGDVCVDEQVGQPAVPQAQEGARLGRVGLHVIAVQVQIARLRAPAGLLRPVLVDPVEGPEALVPVGVVDWYDDEHGVVEERGPLSGDRHVAQQGQTGVLAVHLAGVDGVLHQDDRAARPVQRRRIEHAILRGDDHHQVTPFLRPTEGLQTQHAWRGRHQPARVRHRLRVTRRRPVVADLGGCAPVNGLGRFRPRAGAGAGRSKRQGTGGERGRSRAAFRPSALEWTVRRGVWHVGLLRAVRGSRPRRAILVEISRTPCRGAGDAAGHRRQDGRRRRTPARRSSVQGAT